MTGWSSCRAAGRSREGWIAVWIYVFYVDPDVGDAGMGSMGPERFSPSDDDAGGTIYLVRRRQLRHHRRFRGGDLLIDAKKGLFENAR